MQTSVERRRVLLQAGLGAALQVLGDHVLLDVELRHLGERVHVVLDQNLLLLDTCHVPVLRGRPPLSKLIEYV